MKNNDRFKFRLWDKESRFMTYSEENKINLLGQLGLNDGKFYDIDKTDYILMQCTGLTDSKGIFIYEGDIVKVEGWSIERSEPFFNNVEVEPPRPFYGYDFVYGEEALRHQTIIIGNIHENPKLLENE